LANRLFSFVIAITSLFLVLFSFLVKKLRNGVICLVVFWQTT
jgi:hypothetical protein